MSLAENGHIGVFQFHADVAGDDLSAGEDGDILQHFLAAIAESRSLDTDTGEGAAQFVQDDGGEGFAFHVLSDDEKLAACLHDLLKQGKDVLNVGDLLVGDKDERVIDDGFHLVGIGDHVGSEVAAVELHAFHHFTVSLSGLGLFNGDDAVLADFFHGVRNQAADQLVTGRNGADTGDILGAGYRLRNVLDCRNGSFGSLLDAFLHDHRVGTRGQILQTFADHGLGEDCGGGSAVAGDIVGLRGDFLDELRAHIFKGVFQLDLLGNGYTVVGDEGSAVFLI